MKTILKKFGKWLLKNASSIIEFIVTGKTSKPLANEADQKKNNNT